MKRMASIILFLFCLGAVKPSICFAQVPSVGQIEKTQQDIEKNRALRETIEESQKVFIKKIIVEGATLITEEQIKEIILPFQNHWLSKKDIQVIISLLKATYNQKGYNNQPAKISLEIKKHSLKIQIEEN